MSLTVISSLESARRKFFMNSTGNMCKNLDIKRFGAQESEMSLAVISSLESARRKFFMKSTENMCKNVKSNVLGLRRPK